MNNQYFPEELKKYFDNKFNEQLDIIISTLEMLELRYKIYCDEDSFELFIYKKNAAFPSLELLCSYLKDPKAFDVYVHQEHDYIIGRRLTDDNFDDLLKKVLEII
ncbi:hypothetical protein D3C81_96560 [compost metagenome]